MMFSPGQIVVCVDNTGFAKTLKKGARYTVNSYYPSDGPHKAHTVVVFGIKNKFRANRFRLPGEEMLIISETDWLDRVQRNFQE